MNQIVNEETTEEVSDSFNSTAKLDGELDLRFNQSPPKIQSPVFPKSKLLDSPTPKPIYIESLFKPQAVVPKPLPEKNPTVSPSCLLFILLCLVVGKGVFEFTKINLQKYYPSFTESPSKIAFVAFVISVLFVWFIFSVWPTQYRYVPYFGGATMQCDRLTGQCNVVKPSNKM